jgi:hypothetical protein
MNFTVFDTSQRSVLCKAALLLTLVSGFLIAADELSIRWGLGASQRILDDLLGGLIAGSIFYLYERHRLRRVAEQLRVIDLMNHHIRNALQPLMFVPDESEREAQLRLVEDCVRHIEWALREVLPGRSEERFVVGGGRFVRKTGQGITSRARSSLEMNNFRPEPTTKQPKPPFSEWLNTWKGRNEKVS